MKRISYVCTVQKNECKIEWTRTQGTRDKSTEEKVGHD